MKHDQLRKFTSPDTTVWTAVIRQLGLAAAACYKFKSDVMTQVIQSDSGTDEPHWPAVVSLTNHYTPNGVQDLPVGWFRPALTPSLRKSWPKGVIFYFPVQDLWQQKFVFAIVDPPGRRRVIGELDGTLEAAARRISFWNDQSELNHFVSEVAFAEHTKWIAADFRNAFDHEIRTPLSSIIGYANLLAAGAVTPEELAEFHRIIADQAQLAAEAVNKISQSLMVTDDKEKTTPETEIDVVVMLRQLCGRLKKEAVDLIGVEAAHQLRVSLRVDSDDVLMMRGAPDLVGWSLWEVIKNAALHALHGQVAISVFRADDQIVIDIEDDGKGVSQGAEELIFLRFYRDPGSQPVRRGKRGLGLGLFLARYLTEKHLGSLSFVRNRAGHGQFRFIFPVDQAEGSRSDGESERGRGLWRAS